MNARSPLHDAGLPAVLEAEQALLGALLMSEQALALVSGFLEPRHFSEALHAGIYSSMLELAAAGRKTTVIGVRAQLDLDDFEMPEAPTSAAATHASTQP